MPTPKTFGRRVNLQPATPRPAMPAQSLAEPTQIAIRPASRIPSDMAAPSRDDDFAERRRNRNRLVRFPWRPFLLMASLSFGIASFVLPDTVNDAVQYLLWALTAASLIAWIKRPKRAS
jgi:hypothetical protein